MSGSAEAPAAVPGAENEPARRAEGPENAFSVDVEDYYQVAALREVVPRQSWSSFEPRIERNTRRLLEILDEHGIRATFFVLGWIGEHWPHLIREIRERGHEIASHGFDHRSVTELTPEAFRADVRKTKGLLEDITGVQVIGYRAPNYSIVQSTLWALDIILEEGHRYDSSIFPIRHDRYGIPGAERFPWRMEGRNGHVLHEFPISTIRLAGFILPFVGGGYLRQLPWWFVRWGMRRLNARDGQPAVVYIHPWEIDPQQPRQPVGLLNRLRHYRNLDHTEERLARLFREFRFTTVREVLGV